MATKKILLVLVGIMILSFSFTSNLSIGFAAEPKGANLDSKDSYYFIKYQGEEETVQINDRVRLHFSGWSDDSKTSITGKIEILNSSEKQTQEVLLNVNNELNKLDILNEESINYRISESDFFEVEEVFSADLNDQVTVLETNENGTSIEELKTIDEHGTVIENKGLTYYLTKENNEKVPITEDVYHSLNAKEESLNETETESESSIKVQSSGSGENNKAVSDSEEAPSQSFQTFAMSSLKSPSVVYSTHVQSRGWLKPVSDGTASGTEGEAKRLESIKIALKDAPHEGGITYKTHVQSHGWLDFVSDNKESGTTGEGKRLEAIQIKLTGEMANHYDVYYRVHAQTYGWLDWAKNGESAGTQGLAKRLEAIEIVLVEKGGQAPGSTTKPLVMDPSVTYSTHVQSYGWLNPVSDGKMSGTEGEAKRLEAIKISLKNAPYSGGITYKTHVQSYGWLNFKSNGAISGTSGEAKRLEAIQIKLTGEMANHFDVYYRVHSQTYGWLDWAKNGESAGTQGLAKRLEGIEIVLIEKGGNPPGSTKAPLIMDPSVSYSTHVQSLGWLKDVKDGELSGTTGKGKQVEAIKISLKNIPYPGNITYKTLVQNKGWLNEVSNGSVSGTTGEGNRIEAIQIKLTGDMANHYDVYYRAHIGTYGWLGWAKNGMSAGSEGYSKPVEAIEIKLVVKGQGEAVSKEKAFIKPSVIISTNNYDLTLNNALTYQMKVSPQTDLYRKQPAFVNASNVKLYDGGIITGTKVNIRTSADLDTNENIYAEVGYGTKFLLLDDNVTGDEFLGSKSWYKIEYDGEELYVHSRFGTINSRIGKVLSDKLDIRESRSSLSHVFQTVKKDTQLSIVEENVNGWHQVELGNWRNAKSSDVQDYLNPANFVDDEKQRLQFMSLTKTSDVQAGTLNQYLNGKGILSGRGQSFIEAAKKHNVNEVYLMSHALLETGNGRSDLANGILVELNKDGQPVVLKDSNGGVLTLEDVGGTEPKGAKAVYNMYGIEAYDRNPDELGALAAYRNGWFTPEAAIVGGAAFIGEKYIGGKNPYKIVQNTIYEMRWNPELMSTKKVAGNQYATDIQWAYKQVNHMYEVYKIQPYTLYLELPKYK
ncbi:glucosaminidase domain-containing protein [Niallia sp. Krafla_26]|uniref:glucosaminidase domain-containing protein n=1 Tax=Niallia sp. Krafla_26 TaxID=3064703 RepID=UPI003D172BC4